MAFWFLKGLKSIKPKTIGDIASPAPFIDRLSMVVQPASQDDAFLIHKLLSPLLTHDSTFVKEL